jgi:hypothetical protein
MQEINVDEVLKHYLICALWSSCDEKGNPFDRSFDLSHIAESSRLQSLEAVKDFIDANREDLLLWRGDNRDEQIGHDFWLTRNGHGAGFWESDWSSISPGLGRRLTDAAEVYGSVNVFCSKGQIYLE